MGTWFNIALCTLNQEHFFKITWDLMYFSNSANRNLLNPLGFLVVNPGRFFWRFLVPIDLPIDLDL